jgi:hypothetical protein
MAHISIREHQTISGDGEAVQANDEEMSAACTTLVTKPLPIAVVEKPYMTRGAAWGLVWRTDFTIMSGWTDHAIDRFVCWINGERRISAVVAMGQNLEPLPNAD